MIDVLHYQSPNPASDRILLIMLPGAGIKASDFAEQGMVASLQAHHEMAVDVVALRPDLELYLDGNIADMLHREIIEPALVRGYSRFWILGISLGGMGALLYTSAHPNLVEGLVLLAPFLGTKGTVAEVAKAGGLESWTAASSAATEIEQQILLWLQNFIRERPSSPILYLGSGSEDRFAPGHRLLAETLPEDHVVTEKGGHDWDTWLALWQQLLHKPPFAHAPQTNTLNS